ncbi:alpha/beta fold hydrolase [Rhodoferax sp. GW822-FHT02A01]|uniref:PHA/PHB synthase family protein n=1 Tax=Rhodoferax sp. GW822-FHT02A01 TaxID=3141537 RepID=UPI00315DFC13
MNVSTQRPGSSRASSGAPASQKANAIDQAFHAQLARFTQGISPASLLSAYLDWMVHLAVSPGKQSELVAKALDDVRRLAVAAVPTAGEAGQPCIEPLVQDKRFEAPEWQTWPFNLIYQAFLLNQSWWHTATKGVEGVSAHHEQLANFFSRQWLDMVSPSNFLATNPEVLAETAKTGGMNLLRGAQNRFNDALQNIRGEPAPAMRLFRPGHEVAITPGKVVYRNRLIELIQYAPATDTVFAEPVLIIPSWIMKYYILDLSPENSLVRYLVEHGHTVYIVSWKNPEASDRDLGMDDYLKLGVMAAVDAIAAALPRRKIQALGYCLGGTLLAIAAAYMARNGDNRLKSLSLLASELDFTEPGELALFIDESQLAYLDDVMAEKGYLDGKQMAGAFALLNSRDLVWSRMEHEYLMGHSLPVSDLIAWNADATRMPYRQHHEYLRSLYLRNDLAEGRYLVDGKPVALSDIRVPVFALGTQRDTVSPWRSVYKIHLLTDTDVTFCLCTGGHNVGVVNPPGPGVKRSFQLARHAHGERYVDPDSWTEKAAVTEGSWWPAWQEWLAAHSGRRVAPPPMGIGAHDGEALDDAPGRYVLAA